MNQVDLLLIAFILLLVLLSYRKGFLKEVIALTTWIAAFWFGFRQLNQLSQPLARFISNEPLRLGISFALLFFATLLVGGVLNYLVGRFVRATGLSSQDRLLGLLLGLIKALVIVMLLVYLLALTPLREDPLWQESLLIPGLQQLMSVLQTEAVSFLAQS